MGQAKRSLEEIEARGFNSYDTIVCIECISEPAVRAFIDQNGVSAKCSYCEEISEHTIEFDLLLELILKSLSYEWNSPNDECLPWNSREGGYYGTEVFDTWDLLLDVIGFDVEKDSLISDVVNAICNEQWCEKKHYSLSKDKVLLYGWKAFSDFVKNTARFVFYKARNPKYDADQHDEMNPVDILESIGQMVKELGLVKIIKKDTEFKRIRTTKTDENFSTAEDLGSPPADKAVFANRMSPSGIHMFYGAFDVKTALKETYETSEDEVKAFCATFKAVLDLVVIDLSSEFEIPSLFDAERRDKRGAIKFLIDFVEDFSKPIQRSDGAHVEYVPTQIVTEYFRHLLTVNNQRIDAVIYPSSKEKSGKAIVIFANSAQCIEPNEAIQNALLVLHNVETFDPKLKLEKP